ncbi:MAG: hypothetical protein LBR79_06820 [Oscillospiraceae bacterium]|jgi:hypothetical protein|nr:hypothetical protein [Oscillospiraceae bacterium]
MIEDKAIITTVLKCAEYLNQIQIPTFSIKQMIYSQLKDYSFADIKKIADDEDILFLMMITEDENDEKQTAKKRNTKRVREGKP